LNNRSLQSQQRKLTVPRKSDYWNNLPKAVYTGREGVEPLEVLTTWGIKDWGKEGQFFEGNFVGWCLVHLPAGWMLSLEGHDFYLVDQHNQIRGVIQEAFERPPSTPIVLDISDEDWYGDMSPEEIEEEKRQNREYRETKPRLVLRTCINFRDSFACGENGPHDFWVENAYGQELYSIRRQEVTPEEYDERMPQLRKKVFDWMDEHYPNWREHDAYWDVFPEADKKWPLTVNEINSAAATFLEDKSNDDLQALRAEMGQGEKRTDYIIALQPKLAEIFDRVDDVPPFHIASQFAWGMTLEMNHRIGFEDR